MLGAIALQPRYPLFSSTRPELSARGPLRREPGFGPISPCVSITTTALRWQVLERVLGGCARRQGSSGADV